MSSDISPAYVMSSVRSFLASPRFLPKGMEPQGRLLPRASHGTGLGIAPALAVASLQWHKRVLVSLDMHRDQEMDFIPVFCALLQEVMSSITLFLSGQGGNKVIGGNACLAPTWVFLVGSRTKSSCSTLREALHILTFLLACFCACSNLNFLLRWSAVLCAVAAMYLFLLPDCFILGLWVPVAASASWHFVFGNALRSFCHCFIQLKSHFRD